MTISWIQASYWHFCQFVIYAWYGWSSIGNYTLGRPLVGGLIIRFNSEM